MNQKTSFSRRYPIKYNIVEKTDKYIMSMRETWTVELGKCSDKEEKERLRLMLKLNTGRKRYLVASYKGIKAAVPLLGNRIELYKQLKSHLLTTLKERRRTTKEIAPVEKQIEGQKILLHGGVHQKRNSILDMYGIITKHRVNSDRKPENNENHVGIEIEFICNADREVICAALIKEKLSKYVRIKTDGSLRADDGNHVNQGNGIFGWEICVISPENKLKDILTRTMKVINSFASKANDSCGLHVHLDMRNRNKETVYHNFYQCQQLLLGIIPKNRRNNKYCYPASSPNWADRDNGPHDNSHWAGISKSSYNVHNTIEIRFHHGSVDYSEIKNWIDILVKIANYSDKIGQTVNDASQMKEQLQVEDNVVEFIQDRLKRFAS